MTQETLAIVGPATWSPFVPAFREALASYGPTYHVNCYGIDRELRLWAGQDADFEQLLRAFIRFPGQSVLLRGTSPLPGGHVAVRKGAPGTRQFLVECVRAAAARHSAISWVLPPQRECIRDPWTQWPIPPRIPSPSPLARSSTGLFAMLIRAEIRLEPFRSSPPG